ncbi:MAG: ATP-binding protein [Armatimonadetes bacterium]|nr:ATP-binding protein [Armatimonadota bacterium]
MSFERNVTVLTGANDTGKSSLLRILEAAYWPQAEFDQHPPDPNVHVDEHPSAVEQAGGAHGFHAWFGMDESSSVHFSGLPTGAVKYEVSAPLRGERVSTVKMEDGSTTLLAPSALPRCVRLEPSVLLGGTVSFLRPNGIDEVLMRVAFGSGVDLQRFRGDSGKLARALRNANQTLEDSLGRVLPPSVPLRLRLEAQDPASGLLALHATDSLDALTDLGYRGDGIRRLLTVATLLADADLGDGHAMILLDEPEHSLHPDAQHAFRRFLEELASDPTRQVVYATHSSCMLNPWRPESVRLLRRTKDGTAPTTVVVERPYVNGYQFVRDDLGLLPTDSLLYGAVTIVVEGATEHLCLGPIIRKLAAAGIAGFADADLLLGQSRPLDARGDNYARLCRVVQALGGNPVLLLDDDKSCQVRNQGVPADIPITYMPKGLAIEGVVPKSAYLTAVATHLGDTSGAHDESAFDAWDAARPTGKPMRLEQTVAAWLDETRNGTKLQKPEVLRLAVEACDAAQIDATPFRKLLIEMRKLLQAQ